MCNHREGLMVSRIHKHLGTAGFALSVVALIVVLGGVAVAASGLNSKQKKEVKTIAKSFQGKGPIGPAGPAGAAGSPGAKGDAGTNGSPGESVAGTPIAAGGACGAGVTGVAYTVKGVTSNVCNGKNGTAGQPGQPWVPDNTLPPGATLTGAWAFGYLTEGAAPGFGGPLRTPISFSIPLAAELDESHVHFIDPNAKEVKAFGNEFVDSTVCTGTPSNPTATAGHLCIYASTLFKAKAFNEFITKAGDPAEGNGASTAGAILMLFNAEAESRAFGTWAVTAPN
jgi:hypothetical protein